MSAPWTSATFLEREGTGTVETGFGPLAGGGRLRASCSHGDPMVLALAGRLDSASVLGAARKLASMLSGTPAPRAVVVDLAELDFLAPAGVRMLHAVADHAASRHTALRIAVGPNPAVAGMFGDARAAAVLDVYPDRPAALAAGADRDAFVGWAEELWNS